MRYDAVPRAQKGLLIALDRASAGSEYSRMVLDYDYSTSAEITARLAGPYLDNLLYGLNESFFSAITLIRNTDLNPLTRMLPPSSPRWAAAGTQRPAPPPWRRI